MDGRENPARDPAGLAGAGPGAAAGSWDDPPASRAGLRIPPFITRQGRGLNDQWPLQDFLELGALVSAVPCARLHARQVLWEWGIGHLGDSTELLVTELITNAIRASREMTQASAVRLWLLSDSAQILILVWDASPHPPVLTDVTGEAEHGRGLMLVEAVSEQWGWSSREDGDGKFVWAIARLCFTPGKPYGNGGSAISATAPNSGLPIDGALSRTLTDESSLPEGHGDVTRKTGSADSPPLSRRGQTG
jgi:anti-sigma regulatory factor (Ser/Thr protein kinase)